MESDINLQRSRNHPQVTNIEIGLTIFLCLKNCKPSPQIFFVYNSKLIKVSKIQDLLQNYFIDHYFLIHQRVQYKMQNWYNVQGENILIKRPYLGVNMSVSQTFLVRVSF